MAEAARGYSDYSKMRSEIAEIELLVASLVDEMVESLERAEKPGEIEERAKILADEARRVASELREADDFELNEKIIELGNLEQRAEELMNKIPDVVIYAEQRKWSGELERITENLHKLKEGVEIISLPHMGGRQRKDAENAMERMIDATKMKLENAKDGILHKKHATKHKTYMQLEKIKGAIGRVRGHIEERGKKDERKLLEPKANELAFRMRQFLANCLEGRAYIDWDVIKISSKITGEEMEWAHDELGEMALGMIFGNTEMGKLLYDLKERKACVVANFYSKPDAGSLLLEFEAGVCGFGH